MIDQIKSLQLYLGASCNLNCSYCVDIKNPYLKDLDNIILNSYDNTEYYLNKISQFFNNKDSMRIEFWGGEPSLFLDKPKKLLLELSNIYDIQEIHISSNFINIEGLLQFINFLNNSSLNKIKLILQCSIDGPSYINDLGRGLGTFNKIIDNLDSFINSLVKFDNFSLDISIVTKSTLSYNSLKLLQTYKDIYSYFLCLDGIGTTFNVLIDNLNLRSNVRFIVGLPNFAVPEPYTVEDGKRFSIFCNICDILMKEHLETHKLFNNFNTLALFNNGEDIDYGNLFSYYNNCGFCKTVFGILPNDLYGTCDNSYHAIIRNYYKEVSDNVYDNINNYNYIKKSQILNIDSYRDLSNLMVRMSTTLSTMSVTTLSTQLLLMAQISQISEDFKNINNAIDAAKWFLCCISPCARDSKLMYGSYVLHNNGILRLLFNGAHRHLIYKFKEKL